MNIFTLSRSQQQFLVKNKMSISYFKNNKRFNVLAKKSNYYYKSVKATEKRA